jgi:hypothetical protein
MAHTDTLLAYLTLLVSNITIALSILSRWILTLGKESLKVATDLTAIGEAVA